MKICIISFHSCPYSLLGGDGTGGMSVYLRELSAAMTRIPGVYIDIFTRIQTPDLRGVKVVSENVRLIHLKGGPESVLDRRRLYDFLPEFTENIVRFTQTEAARYDLIYSHYWLSGVVGAWLKNRFDAPLVHMYHTLAFLKNRHLAGEKEHHKRSSAEEELCSISDSIVSSSSREKQSLLRNFGITSSRVQVIYPGINPQLFHPCSSQSISEELHLRGNDKTLLYVGRIEPVKGLMTVIQALSLLKKENAGLYKQLKLIVVGGGREEDLVHNREYARIIRSVEDEKINDKVVFLGSKKQNELKQYYSSADVLLVPSLYESFGLVVIEALACGTPVLVSRVGDMPTIIKNGQNGYSFQAGNPASIAHCLETFFSQQKSLWDEERIGLEATRKFSWVKTARKTYRLFDELVKNKALSTTIFPLDESLPPT